MNKRVFFWAVVLGCFSLAGSVAAHEIFPNQVTLCDRLAADVDDPLRVAKPVGRDDLRPIAVLGACKRALADFPGNPRFTFQLARGLRHLNRIDEHIKAVRYAAREGYPVAQMLLANYHLFGRHGVQADGGLARLLAERAFSLGAVSAAGLLYVLYQEGRDGVPADAAAAQRWLQAGLKREAPYVFLRLAIDFDEGRNGEPRNPQVALTWAQRAVDAGYQSARPLRDRLRAETGL